MDKNIIVTRTPLRVSLIGGGSDTAEYYKTVAPGKVVSLALDKYIYVVVKKHADIFNEKYRISYQKNEIHQNLSEIENNIIRECIDFCGIKSNLYISTFSDIPASSGLGSSSALAVGLLNALHAFKGEPCTKYQLAVEACDIEISKLRKPIGKQDQFAAAFGGLNSFTFNSNESVNHFGLNASSNYLMDIFQSASLFWTGLTREVDTILGDQKKNFKLGKIKEIDTIVKMIPEFINLIGNHASPKVLGETIAKTWDLKKSFAKNISNVKINQFYYDLISAGGFGGKLCGGGGGGFILMFHPKGLAPKMCEYSNIKYSIPLGMDFSGTEVLLTN